MTEHSIPLPILPARASPGRAYFQCRNRILQAGRDRKGKGKQRASVLDDRDASCGIPESLIYAGIANSPLLRKLQRKSNRRTNANAADSEDDVQTLSYCEETSSQHANSTPQIVEELAWCGSTLIWSKGSSIYRKYTFSDKPDDKQTIVQALFAYFEIPAPHKDQDADASSTSTSASSSSTPPPLTNGSASPASLYSEDDDLYGPFHPRKPPPAWSDDNATATASQEAASTLTSVRKVRVLVILLEEELRLYYPNGQHHIIPISFQVEKIWPLERGILLERYSDVNPSTPNHWFSNTPFASTSNQTFSDPIFYTLLEPFDTIKPVAKVSGLLNIPTADPDDPLQARQQTKFASPVSPEVYCNPDDKLIFVSDRRDASQPVMVTFDAKTSKLSVWAYANVLRKPEDEINAFRQLMKEEALEEEHHVMNGVHNDKTFDRGGVSVVTPHANLGKRRRDTDEPVAPPSSELDIPGFTGEGDLSQRPIGSTSVSRRISALLDRRKSLHNPDATVAELLGNLAPAGNPPSSYSNGSSQDKTHRRTTLLKSAASAAMDRRLSTTRNELSVSLDRMALGAPGAPSSSQQSQASLSSQTGPATVTVEAGQLASHERQERFEALVGNGEMEREVSMLESLHVDQDATSDIYISRLYSAELSGVSSACEVEVTIFDVDADQSTLAINVPAQKSLALFKIASLGTDTDAKLVCQPLRHLEATSMAAVRSTRHSSRELVILDDKEQGSLVTRDQLLQLEMPASKAGRVRKLKSDPLGDLQATYLYPDDYKHSITLSVALRTGNELVDYILDVLQAVLGQLLSPVLTTFWQNYKKAHLQTTQEGLKILGLAMLGSSGSHDGADRNNIDSGLSDWEWLQRTSANEQTSDPIPSQSSSSSLSSQQLATSLFALHLVSEERKLCVATEADVSVMAPLIYAIANGLNASDYLEIASREGAMQDDTRWSGITLNKPTTSVHMPTPFSIYANLLQRAGRKAVARDPLTTLRGMATGMEGTDITAWAPSKHILQTMRNVHGLYDLFRAGPAESGVNLDSFVLTCASKGLTLEDLSAIAPAISLPLREILRQCQLNAPPTWPRRAFALLDRPDQVATTTGSYFARRREPTNLKLRQIPDHSAACDTNKVMKPISHPIYQQKRNYKDKATRFSLDRRLDDVQRMLTYASAKVVKLPPGVQPSEADLPKAQQEYLVLLSRRTLALPVAHAMFHYRVTARLRSAGMSIPKVELAAKVLPATAYMVPSAESVPPEEKTWPYFHSGVATALHVSWSKGDFDASEYAFHRPAELNARHGGFLLGLGLSGQLRSLGTYQAFKYMDPKHEYTSIGLLLGLGAAYIGTADVKVSSALSVHTAALHPPSAAPLNVALSIQAAGLFGIGLLHVASCNRRIADNILRSLSQTHISGVEHPDGCLEAYAMSSGFAYGLVMLGRGDQYGGPSDANILGTFKYLLEGGRGTHLPGAKKNVEGILNAAVTSPAATIALGLTFMRTGRQDVADLLELPQSLDRLDHVRNDIILLRTTCRHLIMWNNLSPTKASIEALVPTFITASLKLSTSTAASVPTDQEVVYWHIVAGGCLAMGLKLAGSAKVEAHSLLVEYLDKLIRKASSITVTGSLRSKLAYQSLQNCTNVVCLALASIMAGTGELNVLRRLRVMHGQVKEGISYGTHMARHMALGLLFLGKGRFTLGTSKIATAALLCAFYPVFPPKASSNRFHLQALRHMWVLAVEPRCLVAKDVGSGNRVYLRLKFKLREGLDASGRDVVTSKFLTAPTLTPSLSSILSIQADSPRYWPVAMDFQSVRNHLLSFIKDQTIYVKRKAGHLSYALDPRGLRSLYTQPESEGATVVYDNGQAMQFLVTCENEHAILNLLAAFQSLYPIARANLVACCMAELDDLDATRLSSFFTMNVIMESLIQDKGEALRLYRAVAQAFSPHQGSPVRNTEALLFVQRFYQDDIYGQLCKQRRQSLLRREYVDSAYIAAEKAAQRLSTDSAIIDTMAGGLAISESTRRLGDVNTRFLQAFFQQPQLSVLHALRDKIVALAGSASVSPAVLQTLLPVMLRSLLQKLPAERMNILTADEKLASLLTAIFIRNMA